MEFSLPRLPLTLRCSCSTRPHCGQEKNVNSEGPRFMTAWKKKLEKDGLISQTRQFKWVLLKPRGIVWSVFAEKSHFILTVTTEIGDMLILVFRTRKLMLRELCEMYIMIQLASSKVGLDSKFWCLLLLFNCKVVSSSLRPPGLQHPRLLCLPLSPGGCSNSCPLSQGYYLTVSALAAPSLLLGISRFRLSALLLCSLPVRPNHGTGAMWTQHLNWMTLNLNDWSENCLSLKWFPYL